MTLYSLIRQISKIIVPDNWNDFYKYVLYTSDDNIDFLRTRYCWSRDAFRNKELFGKYNRVLLACNKEIDIKDLYNRNNTNLKLQLHYNSVDILLDDIEFDVEMGYNYIYIIYLDTNEYAMKHKEK